MALLNGWSIFILSSLPILYLFHPFLLLLIRQYRTPLHRLPRPPSPSFFMGNLSEMHDMENNGLVERWEGALGRSWVYKGFFGGCRLITTDLQALSHILAHAYDYPKPGFVKDAMAAMAAGYEGLIVVEGEVHKRQRKILTPAFTASHIKSLAPIFFDVAEQLKDILLNLAQTPTPSNTKREEDEVTNDMRDDYSTSNAYSDEKADGHGVGGRGPRVDVLAWLSRATLDVIGLAGFGYAFNALLTPDTSPNAHNLPNTSDKSSPHHPQPRQLSNELSNAFSVIFTAATHFSIFTILQVWFPFLRRFQRNQAVMDQARATMQRIGLELIEERRREVIAEMEAASVGDGIDPDKTVLGKDLLSVLIRSSLTTSASQQMSISEIQCQISTFLAAGYETTSSALTWTLYALATNPLAQSRLRAALQTIDSQTSGSPSSTDELYGHVMALPYLDWVVRESLRVHPPVSTTMRVCMKDSDIIPTAETWVGRDGVERSGIEVQKHDIITVPIQAINTSKKIWGEDASVFRPERWEHLPPDTNDIPGLYSNILTFLNGNPNNGHRACIGYRFALAEIKIILYVLLRAVEFSMDPSLVVEKKAGVVIRPFIKSEPHLGNQLPLYVRPVGELSSDVVSTTVP